MAKRPEKARDEMAFPPPGKPLVLRLYPDTVLREMCHPVELFDSTLCDFAEEMHCLMQRYRGIGLAAPQVGILRRVIVADIGSGPVFVLNPEILERSGSDTMTEGCLSLPDTQVDVQRAERIEIKGYNPDGNAIRFSSHGLLARVLQHEVDHLNGILILDHASQSANIGDTKAEAGHGDRYAPSV